MHEHTQYVVRIHKGFSTPYSVDKGLREGCPSSPPLFNLYHHAVMEDFRVRRAQQANQSGYSPGIPWTTKIDGRVHHGYHSRQHLHKKAEQTVLGDIGFADDTGLVGLAAEMSQAEILLETTMRDWQEKAHPEKRKGFVCRPSLAHLLMSVTKGNKQPSVMSGVFYKNPEAPTPIP